MFCGIYFADEETEYEVSQITQPKVRKLAITKL